MNNFPSARLIRDGSKNTLRYEGQPFRLRVLKHYIQWANECSLRFTRQLDSLYWVVTKDDLHDLKTHKKEYDRAIVGALEQLLKWARH